MAKIYRFKNNPNAPNGNSTLNGSITDVAASLVVTSAANFPSDGNFVIRIDSELILVTAVSGTTFTITRGHEGTTGAAHANGAQVYQVVNAAVLNAALPLIVVKPADETVSASTTMQDDADFFFPVDANSIYYVELMLWVTSGASNTPDIKTGWTLPASATATLAQLMYDSGATGATTISIGHRYQNTTPTTAQPAGVLTSAVQPASSVWIRAVIRTGGTAGTAQFQWAQNTSDATGTVVKQDSVMKVYKAA